MKQNTFILFVVTIFAFMFSGCATPQFMPAPTQETQVIPKTDKLTAQKGDIIINVGPDSTPYGLSNKITTIDMTLINPTNTNVTFYPKEYLLFDQNNNQYFPLERDALTEAAMTSWDSYPRYHFGYGYYHGFHPYHYYYGFHPYPYHSYGRSYRGLVAKALPLRPITIHPHSSVSGHLYYPVSSHSLESIRLVITRFTRKPTGPDDSPSEITYRFQFEALK